jgi:hypothetical protein
MMGTVLSLVELATDEGHAAFGNDATMADNSWDSVNCGSSDSHNC